MEETMYRIVPTICFLALFLPGCGSSTYHVSKRLGQWTCEQAAWVVEGGEATIVLTDWEAVSGKVISITPDSISFRDARTDALRVLPVSSIQEVTPTTSAVSYAKGAAIGYEVGSAVGVVGAFADANKGSGFFEVPSAGSVMGASLAVGLLGAFIGGAVEVEVTLLFTEYPWEVGESAVIEVEEILEETEYNLRVVYEGSVIVLQKRSIHIDRTQDPIRITMPRAWL
jgi:hypothetical protein